MQILENLDLKYSELQFSDKRYADFKMKVRNLMQDGEVYIE